MSLDNNNNFLYCQQYPTNENTDDNAEAPYNRIIRYKSLLWLSIFFIYFNPFFFLFHPSHAHSLLDRRILSQVIKVLSISGHRLALASALKILFAAAATRGQKHRTKLHDGWRGGTGSTASTRYSCLRALAF